MSEDERQAIFDAAAFARISLMLRREAAGKETESDVTKHRLKGETGCAPDYGGCAPDTAAAVGS